MSQHKTNPNLPMEFPVRRTKIKTGLTDETMSPLGRELTKLAREIETSDEPALSEEDVEKELTKRRGGYAEDDE